MAKEPKADLGKKRRIIVCIPRFATGGPLALCALARYMSEAGYNVRVFWYGPWRRVPGDDLSYWYYRALFNLVDAWKMLRVKLFGSERYEKDVRFPAYINPQMQGLKRKFFSSCGHRDVVIYPEEIYGNPLGAKNVVRWLLYHYKYLDDPQAYGPQDQFVAYRRVFNEKKLNPRERGLFVSYIDLDLYKQTNFGERSGTCYLVKKGAGRPDLPTEFDGPVIDDLPEREKVKLFNECERFVSYDTQTAYSSLAALCGCESVVVCEPGKTLDDYVPGNENHDGIAYGFSPEQLEFAAQTRHKVLEYFQTRNEKTRAWAVDFGRWACEFYDARDRGESGEDVYYDGALPPM